MGRFKSPITVGENRVSIHTNWVITAVNTGTPPNIAWAEVGWGYNAVYSGHGPDWFYYYYRVNGTEAYWFPLENGPSADPDGSRHAIAIKWTSGGGTYRGYINNIEVMFATGLGDGGVFKHELGLETASCHTIFSSAYLSEFTIQNWDQTWSYWSSAATTVNPPAWLTWSTYPTSGWIGMN